MWKGFSPEMIRNTLIGVILALVLIVVVIQVVAALVPTVLLAFGNLAGISGLSFASFYAANGVVQIIFGAVIFILILLLILLLIPKMGSKGK